MAHFHSPTLLMLDESEVNFDDGPGEGILLVLKTQTTGANIEITLDQLRAAIEEQTGVVVESRGVARWLNDFVVIAQSYEESTTIMDNKYIEVGDEMLPIMPLSNDYGSMTIYIDEEMPQKSHVPFSVHNSATPTQLELLAQTEESLKLIVTGLPPVF